MTIDDLRDYGANVDEGLTRCLNNKDFYIKLVNMAIADNKIEQLEKQINESNFEAAFEIAHTIKGMYANLALTPISAPASEITELLRNKVDTDYTELLDRLKTAKRKLDELA